MFRFHKTNFINIAVLLLVAFLLRVFLSSYGTLTLDFNTFAAWSNQLTRSGFSRFYEGWSDYFPGYLYILWFIGKLKPFLPFTDTLLYKLPAIISDLITGYLIFEIVRKLKNEKLALIASSFYIFNPAILANSTLWGQVDSLIALFALTSIWLLEKKPSVSAVALGVGTLIKPQAAFVTPIILFVMLAKKWQLRRLITYAAIAFFIFALGFVPFYSAKQNFFLFVFERIKTSFNQYPYTSVNAFNFWGVFGLWEKDTLVSQILGLLAFISVLLFALQHFLTKKGGKYMAVAVAFIASFLFLTRMHERHLLPAFAPLAISASLSPALWVPYFGLSITYVLNILYSYTWIADNFRGIISVDSIRLVSLVNLILLTYLFWGKSIKISSIKLFRKSTSNFYFPKLKLSKKIVKAFLIFVIGFSLISRLYSLSKPAEEYFDEVYHAFTARRMLHNDPKAWEWWNTPPEGFAYEWTHPPLAKEIMVLGMIIFGENSFAWRLPGVLLGAASTLFIYLISKKLFKDEAASILASAVFALDGLPLVMSRIGMNDIYFLFFVLASLYFFLKDRHFLSALSLGLAAASKWSTVWFIPILFVTHFVFKKKVRASYLWFLVIPPLVYLASYVPMFLTGHDLSQFWEVQKQMWWYHTGLTATHAYTSPWWSWPALTRPIYLYIGQETQREVAKIYAMGNPIIFWFGLGAVVWTATRAFITKNKRLGLIIFSYIAFFVPWAASPRIMFLYHYLPSIPFLALAAGFTLRKNLWLVFPVLMAATFIFVFFYPHWTGLQIPTSLDESYYWFESWR